MLRSTAAPAPLLNLIWLLWMWQTDGSPNHLPDFFLRCLLSSKHFLWAFSQLDMRHKYCLMCQVGELGALPSKHHQAGFEILTYSDDDDVFIRQVVDSSWTGSDELMWDVAIIIPQDSCGLSRGLTEFLHLIIRAKNIPWLSITSWLRGGGMRNRERVFADRKMGWLNGAHRCKFWADEEINEA